MNVRQLICFKHDYKLKYDYIDIGHFLYQCTKCGTTKDLYLKDFLYIKPIKEKQKNFKVFIPIIKRKIKFAIDRYADIVEWLERNRIFRNEQ